VVPSNLRGGFHGAKKEGAAIAVWEKEKVPCGAIRRSSRGDAR